MSLPVPTPPNSENLGLQASKQGSLLSGEINIESIRVLEEQIREHERIIIKLKRARNSLLNVSKLPPEVLGDIFRRNVTLKDNFDGLEEGSRNFLLVCRHWFEVASHTPEVWSFWGNTRVEWARWHHHSGTSPLDLVLYRDHDHGTLDVALCDTLRDRAARDAIRRVHLHSDSAAFITSIISPLTAACEGIRSNGVVSFILSNDDQIPVDVSDFLAPYRFPKLQSLELYNCRIASWDFLTSRTAVLTTLVLQFDHPSPTPTTTQLLSILASNPALRKVSLSGHAIPEDGDGKSLYRVSLHHLWDLWLTGGSRHVIGLLRRLNHPTDTDLDITLSDNTAPDIARIVGPYLRDHLRHRDRSRNRLSFYVGRFGHQTALSVSDVGGIDLSTLVWTQILPFVSIIMVADHTPQGLSEKWFFDFITHIPRDQIVSFRSWSEPAVLEEVPTQFPNLRALEIDSTPLSVIFPESNLDGNKRFPPSLQHLVLRRPEVDGGDWSPLTTFLAYRAPSGTWLDSLTIISSPHMCLEVERYIGSMVQEFESDHSSRGCPFGACPEG